MRMIILIAGLVAALPCFAAGVTVLTYHDVKANPGDDSYAVSTTRLRQHLEYLKKNNYQPISLSYLLKVAQGRARFPAKAVLLTFDDGLSSYKTTVVPMLKQYGYPSVLSVVSRWADGESAPSEYKGKLLNWKELKALDRSRLVEVVSHSHDLHRWVISSPQQTMAPAAITRIYQSKLNRYESEKEFRARINKDLLLTRKRFKEQLGHLPRALTWPYGEYDQATYRLAKTAGFSVQLTLDEGEASTKELPRVRRYMLLRDHGLKELKAMLDRVYELDREQRYVEIDLDLFAYVSKENHNQLIQQLVARIGSLGVNTVVVTPFTSDGLKAFFPNEFIPVEHDLLNGVLDRIQAQLAIEHVYLRIPAGKEKLGAAFYSGLARSSRFSAVLFDVVPADNKVRIIRAALNKYLPQARIGSWGNGITGLEVSIVKANNLPIQKNANGTVLVYIDRDNFLTASGLSSELRALRKRGVKNYGYGSLNYMAGPRAPEVLVEAMGYRVHGANN